MRATLAELDAEWQAKDYHVFDKNCVHFASVLADRVCNKEDAIEPKLLQGVLDVSERMLDSLEWRRALVRRVMNEVTRLVVVSWGKASRRRRRRPPTSSASAAASERRRLRYSVCVVVVL